MIAVSDAWKQAHTQKLLPESFVEIRLDVVNNNISGSVSSNNAASFSNGNLIWGADRRMSCTPNAFLEHNMWSLDGSKEIADSVTGISSNSGFVSNNDSETTIILQANKTVTDEIPGITITWCSEYNEYATAFKVSFENTSGVIATVKVTDNDSVTSVIDKPVSNFDSVKITVSEWSSPEHRIRIDGVKFGKVLVFDKNQIINYTQEISGDPLGTELSKNSITFELDNSDGRWNIMNPDGMAKYLYDRQRIVVYYGLDIGSTTEWIQAGVFYLSEWRAPANGMVATFVARDVIEFMMNVTYSRTNFTATTNSVFTLETYNSLNDVFGWYDWEDRKPVSQLPANTAIKILDIGYGYDATDGTKELAFQTEEGWIRCLDFEKPKQIYAESDIENAIATCFPKRDKVFRVADSVRRKLAPLLIREIAVSQFLQQCGAACGATMWQNADETIFIEYPKFYSSDYRITQNVCYSFPEIELTKPIKNIRFTHHYYDDSEAEGFTEIKMNDTGEDITVDCAYFWGDENPYTYPKDLPESLEENYRNWWKHREMISGEFRADPRLELFDTVTVESRFGEITPVVITNLKYTYNGSFRGTFTGKCIDSELLEDR